MNTIKMEATNNNNKKINNMKKLITIMSIVTVVVMVGLICSCGNSSKSQPKDNQSTATKYEKDDVEKVIKLFLSDYVNSSRDNTMSYLSEDFKEVIKKWESNGMLGEWNMFGLNSSAQIEKYNILSLSEPVDNRVGVHVGLWIENEGDYDEDEAIIYLKLENNKWVVDEIDQVKQRMKMNIIENE